MRLKKLLFPALLCAVFAGQAQAIVIDFDAHADDFGSPIVDSGFQFDFTAGGWGVFGPASGACCNVNYNGTTSLFADGDNGGQRANVVMTKVGGGTFDVSSLDAAVYWIGASGTLELTGALSGGGTVTTSLNVGTPWQSFAVGFTDLVSLKFQDSASGAFLDAPGFGIDNISTAPVPEPETYALMLLGLGALGVRRLAQRGRES